MAPIILLKLTPGILYKVWSSFSQYAVFLNASSVNSIQFIYLRLSIMIQHSKINAQDI